MDGERVLVAGPHVDGFATLAPPEVSDDAEPRREGWGVRRVLVTVAVLASLLVGVVGYAAWRSTPTQVMASSMHSVVSGHGLRQTGETKTDAAAGSFGNVCDHSACPTLTRTYVASRTSDTLLAALMAELEGHGFRAVTAPCVGSCERPDAGPNDVRHVEHRLSVWKAGLRGYVEIGPRADGRQAVAFVLTHNDGL
jgi:hypothetical protein